MTTKTKSKTKTKPVEAELATRDAAIETLAAQDRDLSAELAAKRKRLNGPMYDANTPGLIGQLQALRINDPTQFKADETAIGPDAKKLQAAIDEVGDLGPLIQEADHNRALLDKARLDRTAFIAAHAPELLAIRMAAAEGQSDQVDAAIAHACSVFTNYLGSCGLIAEVLTAAGLDNRVEGEEQASARRQTLEGFDTLPAPRPKFQPEAASAPGSFDNPTEMQTDSTQELA